MENLNLKEVKKKKENMKNDDKFQMILEAAIFLITATICFFLTTCINNL